MYQMPLLPALKGKVSNYIQSLSKPVFLIPLVQCREVVGLAEEHTAGAEYVNGI